MLEFRTMRPDRDLFNSRLEYLSSKTVRGRRGARPPFDPWLCHAIARVNEKLTAAVRETNDLADVKKRAGFPWPTLILGSGCLNEHDDDSLTLQQPAAIRDLLVGSPAIPGWTSPGDLAKSFADSLIRDRLGHRKKPEPEQGLRTTATDEAPAGDLYTAKLVLAAALLTLLYHEVEAIRPQAFRRWGNDKVSLVGGEQRLPELRTIRGVPLQALLTELEGFSQGAVRDLLGDIRADLADPDKPRIQAVNVRVLTECAWQLIDRADYPGWSDLLTFLSRQPEASSVKGQGQPRPSFDNLQWPPDPIERRYLDASERSWKQRQSGASSPRARFYDSVAHVLHAQSKFRASVRGQSRPPAVSAFVTSFDLELEMALVTAGVPKFIVALPVYRYRGTDEVASICWIGAIIESASVGSFQDLVRPSDWMMLSDIAWNDGAFYSNMPFVVRLTGCPMLHLPEPSDVDGLGLLKVEANSSRGMREAPAIETQELRHAVVLDEYSAMQQHSADAIYQSNSKEGSRSHGLPLQLMGGRPNAKQARFWMVMGVAMGDSSVRYRVASRFDERDTSATDWIRLDRAGVVIASRMEEAQQDLLDWYGFDVVLSRCGAFRADLDHYVQHLESPDQRTRFDQRCPLSAQ